MDDDNRLNPHVVWHQEIFSLDGRNTEDRFDRFSISEWMNKLISDGRSYIGMTHFVVIPGYRIIVLAEVSTMEE